MTTTIGDSLVAQARWRRLLPILCAVIGLPIAVVHAQGDTDSTPTACASSDRLTPGYNTAPHTPPVAWCYEADNPIHAVAALGESVFLATQDGRLVVLDRASGQMRWASEAGTAFGEIAVRTGMVVGGGTVGVTAWDLSGRPLWTAGTPSPVVSITIGDANEVYVASADGTIVGIDGVTGAPRWQTTTSILRARLAIYGNRLYAFNSPREVTVAVLDTASGELRSAWIFDIGPKTYLTTPIVAGRMLVAGYEVIPDGSAPRTGGIIGMDPVTGAIPWNLPLDAPVQVSPVEVGGTAYVLGLNGQLFRLEPPSGLQIRPMEIIESRAHGERGVDRLLTIGDGTIYISQPGSAAMLDTGYRGVVTATDGTGEALWRFRLRERPLQPVAIGDGDVFIPDGESLFAILAPAQAAPVATPVQ